MGLRQSINENPVVTTAVTVVIMATAIGYIVYRSMGHSGNTPRIPTSSYFSDDDGKTWYIDDARNIPPYDHNGKQAYRAVLFKCPGGKPFIERLEGFDPEAKERIQADIKSGRPALSAEYQFAARGMMIKRPGEKEWVQLKDGDSAAAQLWGQIMTATCPDGTMSARPVSVEENAQP